MYYLALLIIRGKVFTENIINWRASETLSGVYKFELARYIYLITSLLRNIASQLQCIRRGPQVNGEQYFSIAM